MLIIDTCNPVVDWCV